MRPNRTLPLAFSVAALAALVAGCAEELVDTGSEPIVGESADTGLGLAADGDGGDPPAWEGKDSLPPWEGEGPPPWADDIPGRPDSIVDPADDRLRLTITATGPLKPDAGVKLTIKGVAREAIDSGEVVLALPTRAIMDHALDTGVPEASAKARWDLPAMAKGGTWSGSYTVPGEAAGYYSVLVNAYTHGPDGGPWLFDDVSREAWMFVSETDGQLTRHFKESLFPEGIRPEPGPATAYGAGSPPRVQARHPDYVGWHADSVYLQVVYYNDWRRGFLPAVGMGLYGEEKGRGKPPRKLRYAVVPEDGIVSFGCPSEPGRWLEGKGWVPETDYVRGRDEDVLDYWWASGYFDCGSLKTVQVNHNWYLAWRHLDVGGERISKHFGHYRANPVNWNVNFADDAGAKYNWFLDKITLRANFVAGRANSASEGRVKWVAAHEYGHALHEKALGGLWWETLACSPHYLHKPSSHRCAMQEGFADYAGTIGSGGHYEECFEHFGDPGFPMSKENKYQEGICRRNTGPKPKIEGRIAALLLDLTDDTGEEGDYTEYPGKYVAEVFRTCRTKSRYQITPKIWKIPATYLYIWWARTNVSNFVWCLEEEITPMYHEEDSVFGDIDRPWGVSVKARHPPNRRVYDIRQTWLHNLN